MDYETMTTEQLLEFWGVDDLSLTALEIEAILCVSEDWGSE